MRRIVFCLSLLLICAASSGADELPLDTIQLPSGFHIELVARVPNAREMTLGQHNVLYIGSMQEGKVYALEMDNNFHQKKLHVIASNLKLPIGVAYHEGSLYVSAVDRIIRFDQIDQHLADAPKPIVVRDDLPKETHHGGRFIAFGPDGYLYVPVGAPCNICAPDPARYAGMFRMKPDGTQFQHFAGGIRNTVGFDWHPITKELWFTDNGRDLLGDDAPPDELNHAPKPGMNFGYPYCHGGTIADPEFGSKYPCDSFTPPTQNLGPHVASLGMRFYTGKQFPSEYHNQIFIAEHGSWNRSKKIGYRISVVKLNGDKALSYAPFATGWLSNETPWGRPVDVLTLPDGSLLISDDYAGAIYRIYYRK
ncbi:MAG: PQQ-dependent sugar dehydrogenase [Burkholderiaceae bacterium]